jgi:hypothetical protein
MKNDTAQGILTSIPFPSLVFRTYVSQRCGLVQAYANADMSSGQYDDRQMALHQAWIGLPGSVHAAFGQASHKTDGMSHGRFREVLHLLGRRSAIESLGPRSSESGRPTILSSPFGLGGGEGAATFARWTKMCKDDRRAGEINAYADHGDGASQRYPGLDGTRESTATFGGRNEMYADARNARDPEVQSATMSHQETPTAENSNSAIATSTSPQRNLSALRSWRSRATKLFRGRQ